MALSHSAVLRRLYWRSFLAGVVIVWPVLSVLLAAKAVLGVIIAAIEGWSLGQGVYFAFVTGLTIGYGDFVPRQPLTQAMAVGIGFLGIILIGLVSALGVKAFQLGSEAQSPQVH
ncbi:MAG: potassium channel family protein [Reyranella sp.]|uniref:potassium channel family protein n=1 Tax=Reyranella sp. TaxID=1929291 RepID=UPI003D0C6BD0